MYKLFGAALNLGFGSDYFIKARVGNLILALSTQFLCQANPVSTKHTPIIVRSPLRTEERLWWLFRLCLYDCRIQ